MSLELKALIEEAYCIGCTKCIAVCPTDAIVGARRVLHTVIADHCTSCENCIQVCPTDCITLKTEAPVLSFEEERALTVRKQKRLGLVETKQLSIMQLNNQKATLQQKEPELDRKKMVLDAIARVKQRKQTH